MQVLAIQISRLKIFVSEQIFPMFLAARSFRLVVAEAVSVFHPGHHKKALSWHLGKVRLQARM